MILNDKNIFNEVVTLAKGINTLTDNGIEHPLDAGTLERIDHISDVDDLYKHYDEVYDLWKVLIEKALKCLKYHDEREPFQDHKSKIPMVYGIDKLAEYFKKYSDFEGLLYGADKYYRDHVFHVFRTWATGIYILLTEDMAVLKAVKTDGDAFSKLNILELELISMWTVAALCHDLGYPLEKARDILSKTKEMTQSIVGESEIWADMSFSGIQEEINLMILKFISSKMIEKPKKPKKPEFSFKMRVQPKYYIKLSKSLEKHAHGILGSIILTKSLVYFMESEFGVDEDGDFNQGDHKQFYVKREILRAIAFHTCPDIYHMSASSLPFLLILCDEVQNWDRRNWKDHYAGQKSKTSVEFEKITPSNIRIIEKFGIMNLDVIPERVKRIQKDFEKLKILLRDGIDTTKRNFDFCKTVILKTRNKGRVEVVLNIPKDSSATLMLSNINISDRTFKSTILKGIKEFCDDVNKVNGKYRIY